MIKLEKVSKYFGKIQVLKDINLEIQEGESIAILGANGSGKTTLVEMIAGSLKPSSGKIIHSDKNINIGIQFQDGSWPLGTTPKDLIIFYKGNNYEKDNYVLELLDIFELNLLLKKDLNSLSAGQKQRFNSFLSVVNEPKILILDELITGLDLKMQVKLTNFFNKFRTEKKISLIIVSHIPEEVEILSDRIIILKDGFIFEDVKMQDMLTKYGSVRKRLVNFFENENK
ncbi:peptide/nickel transport system ATP-binding protein [Spiroplasma syrphidicola EA-1]|uniref:Peptide/nickel transport system ATP-binding protein n=1 Tax=Spiroplasma syrphidicola EA-1 TaxID=1276229 RepID=R4U6T4_9MOLU|nr:ABC transporter ATP-binding protein [Spiroplasma syrphidicola]AGM26338.1 peptide/nickel transport system ATP-binding protein [Spiroplasma syrphidicola EA-1]